MTPEELKTLYSMLAGLGLGTAAACVVAYLIIRFHLSAYLGEKGKNLATKEDIAGITKLVEDVRAPYLASVENLKGKHQLRMAAIDVRLRAHQEAFTLWREVLGAVHSEEIGKTVIKCQTWWEQNCIYLEPKVRDGFVDAYSAASSHGQLVQGRSDVELVKDNWSRIIKFPNTLFEAVELPGLTEGEAKALDMPTR
ncbi:hypothetical protein [Polaromonas jejuensis]|uniref:DUF4760 domain-containing protein n=1 Tax=Polaromonas jejuensis TaxID=457502 RepID=A0ABW0QDT3_9BURK|nr:hypothetical protein [Polaromonas jejuensis]